MHNIPQLGKDASIRNFYLNTHLAVHYSDVTLANNNENTTAQHYWSFLAESIRDRRIPFKEGQ